MDIGTTYSPGNTKFVVWAPLKKRMILHIVYPFEKKIEMQKDDLGYFHAETKTENGSRYFFMPEEEKDLPDPASKFQPDGVHGPSEVIDENFEWTDANWKGLPFEDLVLYELHAGIFTNEGTFEAIIEKLDHLISTGINAIEMMPIAQFPGNRNWGYDGVFPYAVQNSYGGPQGLKKLVNACHQKGIAVFLDVVFNHLGPEGNYLEQFGPYFTDKYKTPWGKAINFDGQYCDAVRDFFSDNAIYWYEYFHIDGLRFDAIHEVHDAGAKHFWQFMHQNIRKLEKRLGRSFYTIAESDLNDPKVVEPAELGGFDFSAQWLDDFHHAIYTLVDRERGKVLYADFGNINQLAKAYKDGFVHSGEYVSFRKKKFGTSSAGVPGNKFVVFIDNHDQAGNRSTGDCLSSLISFEKLKLAAAAYLLSPYVPLLFMGEEYADEAPFLYFISHGDKELIESVRQGRKETFEHFDWENESPDPYDEKTFNASKLQWEKIGQKKHNTIHRWYRQLILLRKTHAALQSFDKNDVWVNTTDDLFQLYRRSASGKKIFICLFNFSETASISFTFPSSEFDWNKILDSNDEQWLLNRSECELLPVFIQPEKKVIIPRLTAVVYGK